MMSDIQRSLSKYSVQTKALRRVSHQGLWLKVHSDPAPATNLLVGLKVCASNGDVQQSGTVMILKHESHSADFFYKTVEGKLDVWLEIEPFDSLAKLEFPVFTNEGML